MQQLGAWIVSQTAMAMISGVLLSLLKNGPVRSLLRLVCGILLILTALGPIHQISIPDWQFFAFDYGFEGETAAAMGQEFAREKRGRIYFGQSCFFGSPDLSGASAGRGWGSQFRGALWYLDTRDTADPF